MSRTRTEQPRITVLVGRTREDRKRASRSLDALSDFHQPSLLYLTRAQHKVDLVRASFWNQPDKAPTFLPEVRTWGSFRAELTQRFGGPRAALATLPAEMLIGRIWPELRQQLKQWKALPDTSTTRHELTRLIDDWGHSWVDDESGSAGLVTEGGHLPAEAEDALKDRLLNPLDRASIAPDLRHDLQLLLTTWTRTVTESELWTDRAGGGRALLGLLRSPEPPPGLVRFLQRFESVVIDDLLWLSPMDRALLDSLVDAFIRWVPESRIHLCIEDREQWSLVGADDTPGRRITRGLRQTWAARLENGSASILHVDSEPDVLDLADHLLHDSHVPRDSGLVSGSVRLRHYGSERAEVRAIVRALRTELLAGRKASDCYVAFPSLDRYLPLLRDALHTYGIPFSVRKGYELRRSPPVNTARLVLRMALDGPERASLRSLLTSGWVRTWYRLNTKLEQLTDQVLEHCRAAGAEVQSTHRTVLLAELEAALPEHHRVRATMDRIHGLCLRSGAKGGEPRTWLRPIASRLIDDERQRQRRKHPDKPGSPLSQSLFKRLGRIALELEAIEAVAGPIRALKRPVELNELAGSYGDLLDHLGLFTNHEPKVPETVDPEVLLANQQALHTWRETIETVATAAQAVAMVAPRNDESASSLENLSLLSEALESAARDGTYNVPGNDDGVTIVGLRDLHGADVPWLWLGGCVDGEFPRSRRPSFLLPPAVASQIPHLDAGDEDRAIFLSLLRNIGHGVQRKQGLLYISHPHTVRGRDVGPSPLVQDLRALRFEPETADTASSPTTLGEAWEALQAQEEAMLLPVVALSELLVRPDLAPRAETLAQLLPPELRDRMASHEQWCADLADPAGFGPRDGILALGCDHRGQALDWLHDSLSIVREKDSSCLTVPVTGLEQWARCPIRFFFGRVLRADEPEEWSPEPSPRDEGILLHRVLEQLLAERLKAVERGERSTASLEGIDEAELREVKQRAATLVRELAPQVLAVQSGPYRERAMRLLTAGLDENDEQAPSFRGKLASFLDEETTPFLGLQPTHLEWSFEAFEPAVRAAELDETGAAATGDLTIRVSGTIDRIDTSQGATEGLGGARKAVFDYKSGKAPLLSLVDRGCYLQPAVYAAAVDQGGSSEGLVSGYLELPMDGTSSRRRLAGDSQVLDAVHAEGRANPSFRRTSQAVDPWLLAAWLRRVDLYGQMLGSGIFPPTLAGAEVAGCEHCSFRRACRYDAVRTGRITAPRGHLDTLLPVPLAASVHRSEDDEDQTS